MKRYIVVATIAWCSLRRTRIKTNVLFVMRTKVWDKGQSTKGTMMRLYRYMQFLLVTKRLDRMYMSYYKTQKYDMAQQETKKALKRIISPFHWRYMFDRCYPNFVAEPRNVRRTLSNVVILTPYNLPPQICIKISYMFQTSDLTNSKKNIDIYYKSLVNELKQLRQFDVQTYISKKQQYFEKENFQMRVILGPSKFFLACMILSEWNIHGIILDMHRNVRHFVFCNEGKHFLFIVSSCPCHILGKRT